MTNIFIAGYYGLGNIGDEAILAGMITSLRKYIEDPQISVMTNNPEETRALHNVRPVQQSFKKGIPRLVQSAIFEGELATVRREIANCDIFILGGGSLLQDLRVYYLPILLSLIRLAQRHDKKTVVYGIGAGPIDTSFGQKLCRSVLNETDLVTVRDPMSKEVLERCNVLDVIITADPAFGIEVPDQVIIDRYLKSMDIMNGDRFIASTAYKWLHDSDLSRNANMETQDLQNRREYMADIFEFIVNKHVQKVLFVPTVKIDGDGYKIIRELMPSSEKVKILDYDTHFNAVFAALSRSYVLIGMRLHSLIFATLMGVPIVPISYCGKVKSYLDLIGIGDLYLDVEDLGKEMFTVQLLDNLDIVWEKRSYYINHQQLAAVRLKQKAYENAKLVADLL